MINAKSHILPIDGRSNIDVTDDNISPRTKSTYGLGANDLPLLSVFMDEARIHKEILGNDYSAKIALEDAGGYGFINVYDSAGHALFGLLDNNSAGYSDYQGLGVFAQKDTVFGAFNVPAGTAIDYSMYLRTWSGGDPVNVSNDIQLKHYDNGLGRGLYISDGNFGGAFDEWLGLANDGQFELLGTNRQINLGAMGIKDNGDSIEIGLKGSVGTNLAFQVVRDKTFGSWVGIAEGLADSLEPQIYLNHLLPYYNNNKAGVYASGTNVGKHLYLGNTADMSSVPTQTLIDFGYGDIIWGGGWTNVAKILVSGRGIFKGLTLSGHRVLKTTNTSSATYVVGDDDIIFADCSLNNVVIQIPSVENVTGRVLNVKDSSGVAGDTYKITIDPNVGNIDGVASLDIDVNYGSLKVIYNGSEWSVIAFS